MCQVAWTSCPASAQTDRKESVPFIHVTDLYHPHADPDDHWDLASQYALAYEGETELKGILLDYTRAWDLARKDTSPIGAPDVVGVAQMNRLTGLVGPVMVGSPHLMQSRDDVQPDASVADHSGINMVLNLLRSARRPVFIHVAGTSRDIAVAGKKAPQLFAEKCAGIYLNAGTAVGTSGDYNVNLDPIAFAAIFDLPCPIYWAPWVMEQMEGKERKLKGEYSTWYTINQDEVLTDLPPGAQKFLAYMYRSGRFQEKKTQYDKYWLSYLDNPVEKNVIEEHATKERHMWCTAGFLHAAGKSVTKDGEIAPIAASGNSGVFTFVPVRLEVVAPRQIKWSHNAGAKDRFIFRITDQQHYETAMAKALKTLLMRLP